MVNFVVERYGTPYSYLDRGGLWLNILSSDIRGYSHTYKLLHNSSGKWYYGKIDVERPFFVDVGIHSENFYPLIMYHLLGQEPDYDIYQLMQDMRYRCRERNDYFHGKCLEEEFAEKERISSDILKRRGYDSVVFMTIAGQEEDLLQLFYLGNPENVKWFS
jgi:hypothetical protein